MLKAAAGGGGKGMRARATTATELEPRSPRARSEAQSAFGDDSVYLEKALVSARATSRSRCWPTPTATSCTSFERECSIQRRHQKVIEESPSPVADAELRERMGEAGGGARAARSATSTPARSSSWSTPTANFYFLEMNTRLQVEHPVTEMVTGVDLVKLQIRVAQGEPLPFRQEDLAPARPRDRVPRLRRGPGPRLPAQPGHDPRAARARAAPACATTRGVYAGYEVPIHYDPLISKLVAYGGEPRATRSSACGARSPSTGSSASRRRCRSSSACSSHAAFVSRRLSTPRSSRRLPGTRAPRPRAPVGRRGGGRRDPRVPGAPARRGWQATSAERAACRRRRSRLARAAGGAA